MTHKSGRDFDTLVRSHRSKMLNAARKYAGRAMTAEDIVQEALTRVAEHPGRVTNARSIGAWLVGITKRVGAGVVRKRVRRDGLFGRYFDCESLVVQPAIDDDRRVHEVMEAAKSLPEVQRGILERCLLKGLTDDEIASELSIPKGTVQVYKHRAIRSLKLVLRE